MSEPNKTSLGTVLVRTAIGIALMVGGMLLSKSSKEAFEHLSETYGIPLDPGKTIATIGVLLILFPLIKMFFIDPLAQAIGERNAELEKTFGEAEALRSRMETMRREYEQRLVLAEAEAREQIQAQIREAQQLRQTLMGEAAEKADILVREAQEKIELERNRIINDIRLHVVDLTLAAAAKVVGENMDTDKNRRMVDEFIETAEVAR